MPNLQVRKANEVPARNTGSRAVREQQELYEGFIKGIAGDVGELALDPGEQTRGVKVRLRRAATRVGVEIQIWDADGKVYFQAGKKRGRPRKAT